MPSVAERAGTGAITIIGYLKQQLLDIVRHSILKVRYFSQNSQRAITPISAQRFASSCRRSADLPFGAPFSRYFPVYAGKSWWRRVRIRLGDQPAIK